MDGVVEDELRGKSIMHACIALEFELVCYRVILQSMD